MMMEFTCFGCGREIQAERRLIGEWVKCPMCSTSQVVPDLIIPNGTMYCKNYTVKSFEDENMLWQSYRVSGARDAKSRDAVLRMPSTFFIRNVADFDAFSEAASFRGWENIEGVVCRIDQGNLIGVALDETDDKATNILIRLLGNSLAEIKNPETLSSPATSFNSPTDHARAYIGPGIRAIDSDSRSHLPFFQAMPRKAMPRRPARNKILDSGKKN